MPHSQVLILSLLILASGCGGKPESGASETPAVSGAKPASAEAVPASADAVADASAAHLDRLTQTLRKFSAENQRVPKSLQELVDKGYLTSLPAAPAGRKYVINEKRVSIELSTP